MTGKYRTIKLYLFLLTLVLGIGLLGCGPMPAGADDAGPTDVPVVDTSIPAPTAEPTEGADPMTQDEGDIRAALADHLGVDGSALTVIVEENTGAHARGGVDNGYFLAAKVNGNWTIVADGQGAIDCNLVAQYAFPASMVPECG